MMEIDVYSLPSELDESRLIGSMAVVIDALRATTTLTWALNAGAREAVPLLEIEQAKKLKSNYPTGEVLLGGERKGAPIEGFDLGNSPQDYTPERVTGKTLLFTTTNGTVAMHAVRSAKKIVLAAFVNAAAVVDRLLAEEKIVIVCAGTDGAATEEDLLMAGCLVRRLCQARGEVTLNDRAREVEKSWETMPVPLLEMLRRSRGGRNLIRLKLDADIEAAARLDSIGTVFCLDPTTMTIGRE